jgi:RNA polymerase sigma-70 factor (ECF subfamily)
MLKTLARIQLGKAAMTMPAVGQITELLSRWSGGDDRALDQLVPLVYPELRRIAGYQMKRERPNHTLQPTALINEAYLKLAKQPAYEWANRAHFVAVAARAMRQVLVEHARTRGRKKRNVILVPLEDIEIMAHANPSDFLILDDALTRLATTDVRQARVVELRYFGGLSDREIAELLGVSVSTVERDIKIAVAKLQRALSNHGAKQKTKAKG